MSRRPTDDARLSHRRSYFEEQYEHHDDPWGFDSTWYERRKYACTLAALPAARYRRGVEAGCANGALTEGLAARCDALIAFDLIPTAVERARARLSRQTHVTLDVGELPGYWPDGTGDLVVWSEVAYYLTDEGAAVALAGLERWLDPGGVLVAVHYTGETDYPRPGSSIGPWLDATPFLDREVALRDPSFELGIWRRR